MEKRRFGTRMGLYTKEQIIEYTNNDDANILQIEQLTDTEFLAEIVISPKEKIIPKAGSDAR